METNVWVQYHGYWRKGNGRKLDDIVGYVSDLSIAKQFKWTVFEGCIVIAEGIEASEDDAKALADDAIRIKEEARNESYAH